MCICVCRLVRVSSIFPPSHVIPQKHMMAKKIFEALAKYRVWKYKYLNR